MKKNKTIKEDNMWKDITSDEDNSKYRIEFQTDPRYLKEISELIEGYAHITKVEVEK